MTPQTIQRLRCPACLSPRVKRNGRNRGGTLAYLRCLACRSRFKVAIIDPLGPVASEFPPGGTRPLPGGR